MTTRETPTPRSVTRPGVCDVRGGRKCATLPTTILRSSVSIGISDRAVLQARATGSGSFTTQRRQDGSRFGWGVMTHTDTNVCSLCVRPRLFSLFPRVFDALNPRTSFRHCVKKDQFQIQFQKTIKINLKLACLDSDDHVSVIYRPKHVNVSDRLKRGDLGPRASLVGNCNS